MRTYGLTDMEIFMTYASASKAEYRSKMDEGKD